MNVTKGWRAAHPYPVCVDVLELAPNAEVTIYAGKDTPELKGAGDRAGASVLEGASAGDGGSISSLETTRRLRRYSRYQKPDAGLRNIRVLFCPASAFLKGPLLEHAKGSQIVIERFYVGVGPCRLFNKN